MAFMGVLMVAALFGAALGAVLFWIVVCLLGGVAEGFFVAHMGKRLSQNGGVRPGLPRACRVLGLASAIVGIAAILSMIFYAISPYVLQDTAPGRAETSPRVYASAFLMLALVLLGYLLFLAMGVMLVRIAGLNKRLGQPQPPPVHRVASLVCRVLGILDFIVAAITLLVPIVIILLFNGSMRA